MTSDGLYFEKFDTKISFFGEMWWHIAIRIKDTQKSIHVYWDGGKYAKKKKKKKKQGGQFLL